MPFSLDDETTDSAPESAEIMQNMPEPQQHAIDAAHVSEDGSFTATMTGHSGGDVDADGIAWDAGLHATGADGQGIKTAKGLWRKKRGAKHSSTIGKSKDKPIVYAPGQAPNEVAIAQARAAGAAIAASVFMIGRGFGGEDWAPSDAEVAVQNEAWGNYCVAKGINDFPPGVAVAIAVLGYAGPRLFLPTTQQRVGTIKQWFGVRVAKFRVKRELKKRGISAVVTIKGSKSANAYDSILVDGKPFNEMGAVPTK